MLGQRPFNRNKFFNKKVLLSLGILHHSSISDYEVVLGLSMAEVEDQGCH